MLLAIFYTGYRLKISRVLLPECLFVNFAAVEMRCHQFLCLGTLSVLNGPENIGMIVGNSRFLHCREGHRAHPVKVDHHAFHQVVGLHHI